MPCIIRSVNIRTPGDIVKNSMFLLYKYLLEIPGVIKEKWWHAVKVELLLWSILAQNLDLRLHLVYEDWVITAIDKVAEFWCIKGTSFMFHFFQLKTTLFHTCEYKFLPLQNSFKCLIYKDVNRVQFLCWCFTRVHTDGGETQSELFFTCNSWRVFSNTHNCWLYYTP